MGEINIGLVNEKEPSAALVLTHFHEDLYQQVYIDRSVNNETCHALPRTWGKLHGSDSKFNHPWLQIRSRP